MSKCLKSNSGINSQEEINRIVYTYHYNRLPELVRINKALGAKKPHQCTDMFIYY